MFTTTVRFLYVQAPFIWSGGINFTHSGVSWWRSLRRHVVEIALRLFTGSRECELSLVLCDLFAIAEVFSLAGGSF